MTEVVAEAVVKFRTDTTGVNPAKEGETAGKSYSKGVLSGAKGLAAGIGGLFAAEKVGEFFKSSIDAAGDDAAAQRRLGIALENSTHARKDQIDGVDDWITAQSEATGVSKDDLIPVFQQLASSTGSITKAQKEMKVALDTSAGTGKSLAVVGSALMKANNGTTASLARLGLKTKETTANTVGIQKAQIAAHAAQIAYTKAVGASGPGSAAAAAASGTLNTARAGLTAANARAAAAEATYAAAVKKSGASSTEAKSAEASVASARAGVAAANARVDESQGKLNASLTEGGRSSQAAKLAAEKLKVAQENLTAAHKTQLPVTLTLKQALSKMADTYSGQAAAKAAGFDGTQQRLKTTMHEFEVEVGDKLIPTLQSMFDFLIKDGIPAAEHLGHWIQQNEVWLKPLVVTIGGAVLAYKAYNIVNGIAQTLTKAWKGLFAEQVVAQEAATAATGEQAAAQTELDAAMDANPIGLIVVALGALVAGLLYAYKHSETFRTIVNAALHGVEVGFTHLWAVVRPVLGFIEDHWKLFAIGIGILAGPLFLTLALIITHFNQVKAAVHVLGDVFTWLWNNAIEPALKFILHGIALVIDAWAGLIHAVSDIPFADKVIPGLKQTDDALQAAARGADHLADSLGKIPTHKTVNVDVVTHTDSAGVTHTTGGTVPLDPGSTPHTSPRSSPRSHPGHGDTGAAVPGRGAPVSASMYVAGDYNVQAHDYADFTRQNRRTLQLAALGGRRTPQ